MLRVWVAVDRQQGGIQELEGKGVNVQALVTISEVMQFYLEKGLVTPDQHSEVIGYVNEE